MMLSWFFRMISHTKTETWPRLPRGVVMGTLDNGQKPNPTISREWLRAMPLVKLFHRVGNHDRTWGRSPGELCASSCSKTRGGQVFFGMTGSKGHVCGESGWKLKLPKTGGMLLKPIHLSETEESGISCVRVKSGDLQRNTKSEGNSLGPYRCWSAKAWGANEIRCPSSPCRKQWVFALGLRGSSAQLMRETLHLRSTVARSKLKGIDKGLHKRWSMWFNSIQCAKPYQPLTYEKQDLSLTGWYLLLYKCCMAVVSLCREMFGQVL